MKFKEKYGPKITGNSKYRDKVIELLSDSNFDALEKYLKKISEE